MSSYPSTLGYRKRNPFQEPVSSTSDYKLSKLKMYEDFFSHWQSSKGRGLTPETFTACKLMCQSLRLIAMKLLDSYRFKFVLLGSLQSDPLEKRFGIYRQMSGSNYYVGVKQVC